MAKKKTTLGDVGFAMKYEASKVDGNNIVVDKALWLEIAELLMHVDRTLADLEKMLIDESKSDKINPALGAIYPRIPTKLEPAFGKRRKDGT